MIELHNFTTAERVDDLFIPNVDRLPPDYPILFRHPLVLALHDGRTPFTFVRVMHEGYIVGLN